MIRVTQSEVPELSIRQLCRLFGVGRTWWYTKPTPEQVAARDTTLLAAIAAIVDDKPGYGYRRVTRALHRSGVRVNHKRVLRITKQHRLLCRLERRFTPTTTRQPGTDDFPNLLGGCPVDRPNQVWVADLTYIRVPHGFAYLACVLDTWSRVCVGWRLGKHNDATLALAALNQAIATRHPAPGLRHHSDRGSQ